MKNFSKGWLFLFAMAFIACNQNTDSIDTDEALLDPTVTTDGVANVTQYTATCSGEVAFSSEVEGISYGVCWSSKPHPTVKDKCSDYTYLKKETNIKRPDVFLCPIDSLVGETTYYVRAFATNLHSFSSGYGYYSIGETAYGEEFSFTTDARTPTVSDVDGNVYHTVQIGTQLWILENLRTTKYNDGTNIPTVKGEMGEKINLYSPLYFDYWYNSSSKWYNPLNKNALGILYNGYAVATGILAPTGWHVPSMEDWIKLSDYLGGDSISGGKMKSVKSFVLANQIEFLYEGNWVGPNVGGTNSSGFSALPSGYYNYTKDILDYNVNNPNTFGFSGNGYFGHWWSSTEVTSSQNTLLSIALDYSKASTYFTNANTAHGKRFGFSVRCLKD
ncbi:MAG TPA: fibrobacter succinogenes major paralogous domain-containing protein [Bacteroidales bacterium]|nr:fibrobacter succinogenes major paralogous domain-containing protein [Bacteroidales bacterium]